MTVPNKHVVAEWLQKLQRTICSELEAREPQVTFAADTWQRAEGGGGTTCILENGMQLERAGVGFSHIRGTKLPPSATQKRPELAGRSFEAMGVSVVVHPKNPHAPTSHMNVRFFIAESETDEPIWWFGGGFDLTPYYGYTDDCQHWHKMAQAATGQHYQEYKQWCDEYFCLPHRQEQRGIGGVFFDDLNEAGFASCFELMQRVGEHYLQAYLPILDRRINTPYTAAQRQWQLLRRGRYVEFNLVHDRGTLFGLQSGGRTESILMSMPPQVSWAYRVEPAANSEEGQLLNYYIKPQNWV